MFIRSTLNLYRCLICHQHYQGNMRICDVCYQHLPWQQHACQKCALPLSFPTLNLCRSCYTDPQFVLAKQSYFCFSYQQPIDNMIKTWKFHGKLIYQYFLAESLIVYLQQKIASSHMPDAIMAVPISHKRCKQRGFNQAGILSRLLAKHFHLPRLDTFIRCHHSAIHQASLDAAARKQHLASAFYLKKGFNPPKHIALIDDVMTTGSTLNSISQCLLEAGVKEISFWGLARVMTNTSKPGHIVDIDADD